MLDYILKEPSSEDYKKGHVYPWKCTEMITKDVSFITDYFFTFEYEKEKTEQVNKTETESSKDNNSDKELIEISPLKQHRRDSYDDNSYSSDISMEKVCSSKVRKNIELMDYLFRFLEGSSLNYVLVGYFNKIINFLYYKNTQLVFIVIIFVSSKTTFTTTVLMSLT